MFVYGCAVCIYGRITMTNVRCGKHLKWTPPCHMRHTPTPQMPRLAHRTGTTSNPILWGYITYEPSAAQTFCKYFVKLGENIRNIYRFAQHITHLISILVLLLSSLLTNVQEREYWYNLIGFLSRPTLEPTLFWRSFIKEGTQSEEQQKILCNITMYAMFRLISLYRLPLQSYTHLTLFFVCKGFKFNKCWRFAWQQRLIDIDYRWTRFNRA